MEVDASRLCLLVPGKCCRYKEIFPAASCFLKNAISSANKVCSAEGDGGEVGMGGDFCVLPG
jgi:hypothetical protein